MKTISSCWVGVLLVLLCACGPGDAAIDDAIVSDTSSCSSDGTAATVVGKFIQPVPSANKTNLLILLSNCRWCADAMTPTGKTALTSEGSWSSVRATDGIRVEKTNSMYRNLVAADGRSVRSFRIADGTFAGFEYSRNDNAGYTCDGR